MKPLVQSRSLNAGAPGRSPWGTAMLGGSTAKHIACRAGLGRPGARPETRSSDGEI